MKYSIIIPAYNEEAAIKMAIEEVARYFRVLAPGDFGIVVIDDGSRDRTAEIVESLLSSVPEMRLLKNEVNSGKGYSVRRGMLAAKEDYALFLDVDLSTPISEFEKLEKYIGEYDVVIGSRAVAGAEILKPQPWMKALCGKTAGFCISLILGTGIHDTQCGFKLFNMRSRNLFWLQKINRWSFDAEILFLAKKLGYGIKEIPVCWTNDERSLVKSMDYFRSFWEIVKVRVNYLLGRYDERH